MEKHTLTYKWEVHKRQPMYMITTKAVQPESTGTIESDTLEKAKRRATKASGLDLKRIGNYAYGNTPWRKWNHAIYYREQTDRHALRENQKILVLFCCEQPEQSQGRNV